MKTLKFLFIVAVLFSSCKKHNCSKQGNALCEGEVVSDVSFKIDSFATDNKYVIRSSGENVIGAKVKIGNQTSFDTINFDSYSLLGKLVVFKSGGIIKRKKVTFTPSNKLANCVIEIESCGHDKVGLGKQIWVLTNKIPDDYTVKFDVVEE